MNDRWAKLLPDLVREKRAGDGARAEDILWEIQAVLKKHGCVLAAYKEPTMLAHVEGKFSNQARVLGEVRQITPDFIEWREIHWPPKP